MGDSILLGQNLDGIYRKMWEVIIQGVEIGGNGPFILQMLVQNTVAVFQPALDENKKSILQNMLLQAEMEAINDGTHEWAMLLDAVNRLLNANGNPTGLTGIYAKTWQEIVDRLV